MEWPNSGVVVVDSLNEYEKLVIRMNTPRVVIDNVVCPNVTLIKVDSARNHGILLEAVQVLTDLDLSVRKGYISSDGRWFMNVFHVTDQYGEKLLDESAESFLEQSLNSKILNFSTDSPPSYTTLELTGMDRPGLLSEIYAVLSDLNCSIDESKVWTNGGRIASILFLKHNGFECNVNDSAKIGMVMNRLKYVLRGGRAELSEVKIEHADRRLHQMMYTDRDYDRRLITTEVVQPRPLVSVQKWNERGYSVVNVHCRDRFNLLFDVVCGITDLDYVVFHGTIDTCTDQANLEFYVRHLDGNPISSEAERQRVIQCLQAAIERRATEGLRLELRAKDKKGLLADVTRTFRENGLTVLRAEISTKESMAMNTFYVTTVHGQPVDYKTINSIIGKIGSDKLKVVELQRMKQHSKQEETGVGLTYLGSLVKRNLFNLGLIRSCS